MSKDRNLHIAGVQISPGRGEDLRERSAGNGKWLDPDGPQARRFIVELAHGGLDDGVPGRPNRVPHRATEVVENDDVTDSVGVERSHQVANNGPQRVVLQAHAAGPPQVLARCAHRPGREQERRLDQPARHATRDRRDEQNVGAYRQVRTVGLKRCKGDQGDLGPTGRELPCRVLDGQGRHGSTPHAEDPAGPGTRGMASKARRA